MDGNPQDPPGAGAPSVPGAGVTWGQEARQLYQLAAAGSAEKLRALAELASRYEMEAAALRRALRKQTHDGETLIEIVSQISARALELEAMGTHLLRTVSGHFATPKLLIMRRQREQDTELHGEALQGLHDLTLRIPLDSPLCAEALRRRACYFLRELPASTAELPEVTGLRALELDLVAPLVLELEGRAVLEGLLILGPRLAQRAYEAPDLEFLQVLAKMFAICLRNEALYRRSIIDDLTGVFSRGYFDARLSQEIHRIDTYGNASLGLVMLDVDRFKDFNDRHGHQTGDRVLQELTRVLMQQVRGADLVARYGGEEFVVVLLEIDRETLLRVAQRLHRAIEGINVRAVDGQPLRITASLGAACYPDDADDKFALIERADAALYAAKEQGRNRVVLTPPRPAAKRKRSASAGPPGSLPAGVPGERRKSRRPVASG